MKTLAVQTITKAIASLTLLLVVTSISARTNHTTEKESTAEKSAIENDIAIETEAIELESWMTKPSSWSADRNDFLENDFEESISIENWMTDLSDMSWEIEKEGEMELENWMTQIENTNWNTENTIDEDQELEAWMLSPSGWLNE